MKLTLTKAWSDTKTKTIENKLLEIMHQFIRASAWKKERQAYWDQWEEKRRVEEKRRAEQARLDRIEKGRISKLETGFKDWLYHKDMTEYVAAVKSQYIAENGIPDGDFSKWLEWAEPYLEKINPLNGDYPKYDIKDPSPWLQ